jgi:uncharacterized pyridoxamine 5'-phosphate oxidase family protein
MDKETTFPTYRKLSNGKSLYKILSEIEFIEIQFIQNKGFIFHIRAQTYFEKTRIKEMLHEELPFEILNESIFQAEKNKIDLKE